MNATFGSDLEPIVFCYVDNTILMSSSFNDHLKLFKLNSDRLKKLAWQSKLNLVVESGSIGQNKRLEFRRSFDTWLYLLPAMNFCLCGVYGMVRTEMRRTKRDRCAWKIITKRKLFSLSYFSSTPITFSSRSLTIQTETPTYNLKKTQQSVET